MSAHPYLGLLLGVAALLVAASPFAHAASIAVVNGTEITEAEFFAELREAAGHDVLLAMIDYRIVLDAFVKSGLPLLDAEVTEFVSQRFGSMENYRSLAVQNGVNPDSYLERVVKPQIMLERLAAQELPATEANLLKYYEEHKANYATPETVTLRQIVLGTREDADKVAAALKGGQDFAAAAQEFSLDPAAKETGGLIPEVPVQAVPPPILQALAPLQEGQYCEPLPLGQMFVVLKLEKRTPSQEQPYEAVKERVEQDLLAFQTSRENLTALRDRLRRSARVHIRDKSFKGIEDELRKPASSAASTGD